MINLSPAPAHASVSQPCLDAGINVYSEKPLAGTLAEADRLIETARERGVLLLCAPGVAVTRRFQWLAEIVASGRFGPLSLAVAHHADPGPAAWREYTGDPSVFYREGVGPLIDHGIYRLHGLTMLMGPVRRVQAMGAIGNPTRVVRAGPLAGQTIPVTTPDHVLINMEFASGALGQLLASFGTASTLAPWLELHFASATISFAGPSWDKDAPASIYVDDDGPLGLEGWTDGVQLPPPGEPLPVVGAGRGALHRLPARRGETGAHGRAREARPGHHREDVRVHRGRRLPRDRDDLLGGLPDSADAGVVDDRHLRRLTDGDRDARPAARCPSARRPAVAAPRTFLAADPDRNRPSSPVVAVATSSPEWSTMTSLAAATGRSPQPDCGGSVTTGHVGPATATPATLPVPAVGDASSAGRAGADPDNHDGKHRSQ